MGEVKEEKHITVTDKPKVSWRDTVRWFWDLFGPLIKLALPTIVVWLGTWYVAGQEFVGSTHAVSGYVIVFMAGVACLCVTLVAIHISYWVQARHGAQPLAIEHSGPDGIWWHMGGMNGKPAMQIAGVFHVTNRVPGNIVVSRTAIIVAYRRWTIVPSRHRVESGGLHQTFLGRTIRRDCLIDFWIQPPLLSEGRHFYARVCLIDNLGGENWSRWIRWSYR